MSNISQFPLKLMQQFTVSPSAESAFQASLDLIHLQQTFPMLRTSEEQANNIRKTQEALEVMHAFIVVAYRDATEKTTH